MDWYHYCSTYICFVQAVDNLGAEYYCMDLQGQVIIYSQTSIKRPSVEQSPSMKWSPIKFLQFVFHYLLWNIWRLLSSHLTLGSRGYFFVI